MKRKYLTKTFMMTTNEKIIALLHGYYKNILALYL